MPQGSRDILSPTKKGFSVSTILTLRMISPIQKSQAHLEIFTAQLFLFDKVSLILYFQNICFIKPNGIYRGIKVKNLTKVIWCLKSSMIIFSCERYRWLTLLSSAFNGKCMPVRWKLIYSWMLYVRRQLGWLQLFETEHILSTLPAAFSWP